MKRILLLLVLLSACGRAGRDGTNGQIGIQGNSGNSGNPGSDGLPGIPGLQGEKGEKGDIGPTGAQGNQGIPGINGINGADGASPTVVQLCPNLGVPSYPNNFLEVGFCISGHLYGVYSANGQAALTELPPGTYSSTAPQSCTLTVGLNCEVTQL